MQVDEGAVCTSGNYARYVMIDGQRYSHIVDPRTGWPAEGIPTVTVAAADAVTADGWATALNVLGEAGLDLLPADGVEALMVIGEPDYVQSYGVKRTKGFGGYVEGDISAP
jgi:thiamine biosynthesis lipoprotein